MASPTKRLSTTVDPTGEFPFDVITYVFHLFAVLSRHREAVLEESFRPLGLNLARYRALSVIARLEPLGMSELADFSAVDRTTMTRTVDQLVAAGFVVRETPPEDRRQVLLRATGEGRATNLQALRAVFRVNRRALDGVEEEDQRLFARMQQTMLGNLIGNKALLRRLVEPTRDDDR
jgi:DNA-binding MarR family transcriptional regulator